MSTVSEWNTGPMPSEGWYIIKGLLSESIGGDSRPVWVMPKWFTWCFDQQDDPESISLEGDITPENIQWKKAEPKT